MKYIRNFSAHTNYEAEMSKIPTPSVSYCRKENECHFMPNNVIMFKVGDLNGNTNQTVTVNYYKGGSETIPITEGNKWYVHNIPSGKCLKQFVGINNITDTIISAKIKYDYGGSLINNIRGNLTFIGCDISDLTHMTSIASGCKITYLDMSMLDTSRMINMQFMFSYCESLEKLDMKFDTSNVVAFDYMFRDCHSLKALDLTQFVTSKATTMEGMFYNCQSLKNLNLTNWNVSSVTTMSMMFYGCGKLNTIYMKGCNQITIDKIKAQLKTDGILNNVTIITE